MSKIVQLHEVSNINKCIEKVTLENNTFTLTLTNGVTTDKYKFAMLRNGRGGGQSFTTVGFPFDVDVDDILDEAMKYVLSNKTMPSSDLYDGQQVYSIYIYEVSRHKFLSYQTAILYEFILNNGNKFVFGHYNEHNGYYPIKITCRLYENGDTTPMTFFSTSV